MDVRRSSGKLEGSQYLPTPLQKMMGDPLRSEQRTRDYLPGVLSHLDMFAILIIIVLFITNASIVQGTEGVGATTYLYWLFGGLTFLAPCAVVVGQLYRFMPVDGGIYIWSHRAVGPLWGFLAGFCAWFPGVLVLLSTGDSIIAFIQGLSIELFGPNANWLPQPWQQGIVICGILLLSGWLATLPLRALMRAAKVIVILYGAAIFIVGLAGVVWLASGNSAQTSLSPNLPTLITPHFVLYGVIVLALLGVEVPFNMAAETKKVGAPMPFLRWGPLIVLLAYLFGTFGVMVVVPSAGASATFSTINAVDSAFGGSLAILVGFIFIGFFFIAAVMYNVAFARILFVSSLDQRLPSSFAKINRHRSPHIAIIVQTVLVLIISLFTYFLGPYMYVSERGANLSIDVYNVTQATTTVIWCISMVILFIDLPLILYRFRAFLAKVPRQLIAPPWVLYLCCIVGGIASFFGIWTTLSASWNPMLISNNAWLYYVGISALVVLVVGLLGSAYPRLLGSLNAQTAAARENAQLYAELQGAYAKLSELDHMKDAFLMTASHELRTPLTIVQGYLELLGLMENASLEQRREFLNKARRACDELVLIQANIMDSSRIKLETSSLHLESLQLKEVSEFVIGLFEPLIIQDQRCVEVSMDASITVWADETRLKQVLRNLVANALRYSPPKTPIAIAAQEELEHDLVRVSVSDHGPGIPPEKQEAIFDRFVRLERDMHGTTRGSGLGLAITRQLVEAMHGTIWVESSGVDGEGSNFVFTLPTRAQ
jgi:glutamate:GABA antiporter